MIGSIVDEKLSTMNLETPFVRLLLVFLVFALTWQPGSAQETNSLQENAPVPESAINQRLEQLQLKILELEAALKKNHAGNQAEKNNGDSQPNMQTERNMGARAGADKDDMMQARDTKDAAGMGQKGMGAGSMGMGGMNGGSMGMGGPMPSRGMMMGRTKGMGSMAMPSSLPGFPGASHIYHIGADGFFLNHGDHISLSQEQQMAINQIKESALLNLADLDRKIESAEQELWILTASDQPDAKKIKTKIEEIESLHAQQRMDFIRAVGKTAQVLTDEQRAILTGAEK